MATKKTGGTRKDGSSNSNNNSSSSSSSSSSTSYTIPSSSHEFAILSGWQASC